MSKVRSNKIRKSARGQECTVRIQGVCNFNPETTVLAHVGKDRGMSLKCDDSFAVYACSDCHDWIDGRGMVMDEGTRAVYLLAALERTQSLLIEQGLLEVK